MSSATSSLANLYYDESINKWVKGWFNNGTDFNSSYSPDNYRQHDTPDVTSETDADEHSRIITIADCVRIPSWAASFVIGGNDYKNLLNICYRRGNLVDIVGEPKEYMCVDSKLVTVVTLIATGENKKVRQCMRQVKCDLIKTIKKAIQMKKDGTWKRHRNWRNY